MRYSLESWLADEFVDHKIFYVQNPFDDVLFDAKQGPAGVKNLDHLKTYDLSVFDFSSEHWGDSDYLGKSTCHLVQEILCSQGINCLILSHNPEHHAPDQGVLYYPYWYIFSVKMFKSLPMTDNKKFLLGCLNGAPRPHRIANLHLLKNKPYWDQCCTSFFSSDPMPWRHDDVELNYDETEFWNTIKTQLPNRKNAVHDWQNNLPSVTDSYIYLITETTVARDIFLTEKTWKPICGGQLFLTLGNPGTMHFLQSLGVDIFSDLIDHNYYDQEPDWRQRLKKLHEILDELINQDLGAIYKHTHQRRLQNQQRFFLGEFGGEYHEIFLDEIKKRL
jgi:hypothetical protein